MADGDAVWRIFEPVVRAGETYALPRDITQKDALAWWFSPAHEVFVAEEGAAVLGTYFLRANQQGGGSHVANCGYITAGHAAGRGVGGALCAHSLESAAVAGFLAMQFNYVVGSNHGAVRLWERFGFAVVGTLPLAFRHPNLGFVDVLIMYRVLTQPERNRDAGSGVVL